MYADTGLAVRVIPCLDVDAGRVVKGINFENLRDAGDPVAGLTWLPFTDVRYTAAQGGPLVKNGVPQPALSPTSLSDALVGVSTFSADSRGRFPGRFRLAALANPWSSRRPTTPRARTS